MMNYKGNYRRQEKVKISKEDADIISIYIEFLEVLTHQVLFCRDVYPSSIYLKFVKYGIPVKMASHPQVKDYIKETLESVGKYIRSPENRRLKFCVVTAAKDAVVERIIVECSLPTISIQDDDYFIDLELIFVSALVQVGEVLNIHQTKSAPTSWWIELTTNTNSDALQLTQSGTWVKPSDRLPTSHYLPSSDDSFHFDSSNEDLQDLEVCQDFNIIAIYGCYNPCQLQVYTQIRVDQLIDKTDR